MVGGKPEDIILTSGGTEVTAFTFTLGLYRFVWDRHVFENNDSFSHAPVAHCCVIFFQANNLVLHTAVEHFRRNCRAAEQGEGHQNGCSGLPHIITSNVEHDSVKLAAEHLQRDGKAGKKRWINPDFILSTKKHSLCLRPCLACLGNCVFVTDVTFVPVSKVTARVEVEDIIAMVRPNTCLISIMLANNETGVIMVRWDMGIFCIHLWLDRFTVLTIEKLYFCCLKRNIYIHSYITTISGIGADAFKFKTKSFILNVALRAIQSYAPWMVFLLSASPGDLPESKISQQAAWAAQDPDPHGCCSGSGENPSWCLWAGGGLPYHSGAQGLLYKKS